MRGSDEQVKIILLPTFLLVMLFLYWALCTAYQLMVCVVRVFVLRTIGGYERLPYLKFEFGDYRIQILMVGR